MEYQGKRRSVLCTERILPLPKVIRDALIDKFCPDCLKENARTAASSTDCLARVYLGERKEENRTKPLAFFSIRNFSLHLDRLEESKVPHLEEMAKLMGMALAVMHWRVGIDADDVEFVLGSSPANSARLRPLSSSQISSLTKRTSTWKEANYLPKFKKRAIYLWMLDFNRCKDITKDEQGVKQAVQTFCRNDPYFPRPLSGISTDRELWDAFVDGYMAAAKEALAWEDDDSMKALPERFIERCVAEQQRRMEMKAMAEKRLAH
jgi:hypothetical protein